MAGKRFSAEQIMHSMKPITIRGFADQRSDDRSGMRSTGVSSFCFNNLGVKWSGVKRPPKFQTRRSQRGRHREEIGPPRRPRSPPPRVGPQGDTSPV